MAGLFDMHALETAALLHLMGKISDLEKKEKIHFNSNGAPGQGGFNCVLCVAKGLVARAASAGCMTSVQGISNIIYTMTYPNSESQHLCREPGITICLPLVYALVLDELIHT